MAHCRVCTHRVLEQPRLFRTRNQKDPLRSLVAKNIALAASSAGIRQPYDGDLYLNVMKELRSHFSKSGILTNIGIVDILHRWHPDQTITQTPKSTGILKLAKAGYAHATLDTGIDFYASRTDKPATDDAKSTGHLKDKVEFGRYKYCWKDQDFQVYVADYWETEYSQVKNHYILYPRSQKDVIDGRSQTVDKLITAATQRLSEIKEEIWVYDRGYWRKNHKLWKNVQGCKWDNVILNNEMKIQLVSDIEGFFDRKEDYESFAVPWKRGIILHGLPGNGKTISIKALMRSLASRSMPIPTLYVKSLGKSCDQDDIRSIFEKARETGPCLLVFEDIDSLVSNDVKSFFLNEVSEPRQSPAVIGLSLIARSSFMMKGLAGTPQMPTTSINNTDLTCAWTTRYSSWTTMYYFTPRTYGWTLFAGFTSVTLIGSPGLDHYPGLDLLAVKRWTLPLWLDPIALPGPDHLSLRLDRPFQIETMKVQQARCQEAPTIPPLMEDQTLLTSERSACAEIILASHSQEVRNAASSEIFSAALPSAPSHHSLPVLVQYHPKLTILYTLDIRPLGDALRAAKATSLVSDSLWAPVPY